MLRELIRKNQKLVINISNSKDKGTFFETSIDIRGLLIPEFAFQQNQLHGKVDGVYEMVKREKKGSATPMRKKNEDEDESNV